MSEFQIYAVRKDGEWLDILLEPSVLLENAEFYFDKDYAQKIADEESAIVVDITAEIQQETLERVKEVIDGCCLDRPTEEGLLKEIDQLIDRLSEEIRTTPSKTQQPHA